MTKAPRIFVLTGAGVSAESGLGTFRDKEGLWAQYDLDEVATPQGYARDPAKVHAFYDARRRNLGEAGPNAAHMALARLQHGLASAGGNVFSVPRTSTTCTSGPGRRASPTCTVSCSRRAAHPATR
jgi:hypothetical protein